jgi:hypothetical protein
MPRRPEGPSLWALTLRLALFATLISIAWIAMQASQMRVQQRATTAAAAKAAAAEAGGDAGASPDAITVSAARPVTPPPSDPRLVPFHGLLEGVTDYEDVAQNRAYAMLGDHTRRLTDDEAKRVMREDLDFAALTRAPHLARGEYIQATGLLIKLEPVRLVPGAGPPGVEDAWRGWLMEPGGNECYVFDLIGEPADIDRRDLVRVEGTFLKVLRYENTRGQSRDAPFLIARRARTLGEDEIKRPFRYDYLVVGLAGLCGMLLVLQWKRSKDEAALIQAKRAEMDRIMAVKSARAQEAARRPPEAAPAAPPGDAPAAPRVADQPTPPGSTPPEPPKNEGTNA